MPSQRCLLGNCFHPLGSFKIKALPASRSGRADRFTRANFHKSYWNLGLSTTPWALGIYDLGTAAQWSETREGKEKMLRIVKVKSGIDMVSSFSKNSQGTIPIEDCV